jgi:mono/diheme cytochrome c family protein
MVTGPFLCAFSAVVTVAIAVPSLALANRASTHTGDPIAGKTLFVSTCGVCHRLRDAKAVGIIGPNLDKVPLPQATIAKAVTYGGATVMTKFQASRYSTQMTAYKNVLTKAQIADIAAYVYKATHPSS